MKKHQKRIKAVGEYHQYEEIGEDYSSKHVKMGILVPSNLRLLCAILDVKLEDMLHDFMWMLSYSSCKNASQKKRNAARKFFMLCHYGQARYSKKQINIMFDELQAVRKIYDTTDEMESEERGLFWKCNHMYTEYWYQRWFNKNSRPDNLAVLKEY